MTLITMGLSHGAPGSSGLPSRFLEVVSSVTTDVSAFRALREQRMAEAREELQWMLESDELRDAVLLVLANKQVISLICITLP